MIDIKKVDASIDIQEKYYFCHTFAHSRNMPELTVWHDKRKSHPLAVIARLLPVEDQSAAPWLSGGGTNWDTG